jgi:glycosyltransferase involved in cell wall biosynthesis
MLNKTSESPAKGPLVSVVIPTHNRSGQLKRAIDSVLAQTHRNLEIIIVDDASTDNTQDVVAAFRDPRIRYVRRDENRGASVTRNIGIQVSTGAYIAFLDDDDEWEPEKTEEQLKLLGRYDAVVCTYRMDHRGVAITVKHGARTAVELDDLRQGFFLGASTSALMARGDVLKQIPFDESLPRLEDWDLCIRIAQSYTIGYLNKSLFRYNDGEHSRKSNSVARLKADELERELRVFHKHRLFFGRKWFKRHMCEQLLYDIKLRPEKWAHLFYVVSRYGVTGVGRTLLKRVMDKIVLNLKLARDRIGTAARREQNV